MPENRILLKREGADFEKQGADFVFQGADFAFPLKREGADLPTPFRSYIILYCEHSGVARPPPPVHCTGAPLPNGVVLPADQRALLSSKRFCRVLHTAGALSPTNAPVARAPLSFLFVSFFLPSCAVSLLPPGRAQAASSPQSLPGTVLYRESAGSDALSAGGCSHRGVCLAQSSVVASSVLRHRGNGVARDAR